MHISAAIFKLLFTISSADKSVLSINAFAALCANGPPDPMAIKLSSGSITSPFPVIISEVFLSATDNIASNFLRALSDLQSLG